MKPAPPVTGVDSYPLGHLRNGKLRSDCVSLTSTEEIDDAHFAGLATVTWGLHSFGRFHKHDPKIVSKDDVKR